MSWTSVWCSLDWRLRSDSSSWKSFSLSASRAFSSSTTSVGPAWTRATRAAVRSCTPQNTHTHTRGHRQRQHSCYWCERVAQVCPHTLGFYKPPPLQ